MPTTGSPTGTATAARRCGCTISRGAVGGPVRRDRTFFFLSYEGVRLRQPFAWRMPGAVARARGRTRPEWVRRLLNLFPAPNGPPSGADLAEWNGRNNRPSRLDVGSLRLDHALTPRVTVFARYHESPSANEFGSTQVNRLDLRGEEPDGGRERAAARRAWCWTCASICPSARGQSRWMQTGRPAPCDLEPVIAFLRGARHVRLPGAALHRGGGAAGFRTRGRRQPDAVPGGRRPPASSAAPTPVRLGADYRRLSPSAATPPARQRHRGQHRRPDGEPQSLDGQRRPRRTASSVLKELSLSRRTPGR